MARRTPAVPSAQLRPLVERPVYLESPRQIPHRPRSHPESIQSTDPRKFGRTRQIVCPIIEEERGTSVRRSGCSGLRHHGVLYNSPRLFLRREGDRDEVKVIGLVYLTVSENRTTIRERVSGRKLKRNIESGSCNGDNAFEITDEVLDAYFTTSQVRRGAELKFATSGVTKEIQ